ncbi:MAG TPA: hypothetical protein VGQ52_13810 [Gemmatimonadaceae bacterium]|nr:hypothetical protein [Gemmatimonadaceae bacterium]
MEKSKWSLADRWTEFENFVTSGGGIVPSRRDRAMYYSGASAVLEILRDAYNENISDSDAVTLVDALVREMQELPSNIGR